MIDSSWVVIALGSNQGGPGRATPQENVLAGLERLKSFSPQAIRTSSLYHTHPVNCPPGSPDFVNAVAAFQPHPNETPESLLSKLQALEREFGRAAGAIRNAPRPLDLDLVTFGTETRADPQLTIPHPRAHLRRFVLEPLAELDPDLIMPGQTLTVSDLLSTVRRE